MKKKKPTFWEFLKNIHGITVAQFYDLSKNEQLAAEIDYKIRYGSPIRWE